MNEILSPQTARARVVKFIKPRPSKHRLVDGSNTFYAAFINSGNTRFL